MLVINILFLVATTFFLPLQQRFLYCKQYFIIMWSSYALNLDKLTIYDLVWSELLSQTSPNFYVSALHVF